MTQRRSPSTAPCGHGPPPHRYATGRIFFIVTPDLIRVHDFSAAMDPGSGPG